jgi:hypothetical protein
MSGENRWYVSRVDRPFFRTKEMCNTYFRPTQAKRYELRDFAEVLAGRLDESRWLCGQ